MRRSIRVAFMSACVAAPLAAMAQTKTVRLEQVTTHLFYERSGSFSPDTSTIKDFYAWNSEASGASGADGERFRGVLIKLLLSAPKDAYVNGRLGEVRVTNVTTGKLISRTAVSDVYVGSSGQTYRAIFLPDAQCDDLEISASINGKTIKRNVPLRCGE